MTALLPILFAVLAGIGLAIQAPTNAMLARVSGSVLLAAGTSFVVGLATLVALWATLDRTTPAAMRGAPGWAWLGGFYGAGFVAAIAFAAPRLGVATTLTMAIASQICTALVLDHFGLLGLRSAPITAGKVAGVALLLGGVLLIRRG